MDRKRGGYPVNEKLTDLLVLDNVQKVQDALSAVFDVALLMQEKDGTPVTKPSNTRYLAAKSRNGATEWDKVIEVDFSENLQGRICIITGEKTDMERLNEMCGFLVGAAKYMVYEGRRNGELNRELTYRRELERKLEQRNEHDMLTNLYNRYFYERKITEVIIEGTAPVSVAVIDANLLKLSNDIFGHSEGDCLLQLISAALVEEKKPNYYCCRCGGDEFYVIMVQTGREEAENYLKRVVERTRNDYCTRIPPSFAYGIATKHDKNEDLQEIIKEAEDAMYFRKIDMKCDGKILEILRQCLMETGHFNYDDAIASVNLTFDFCKRIGLSEEELHQITLLLKLYPLGMLIIPADVLTVAKQPVADQLAGKYDYVGTEYRIAMMFEETAPVAHYVMQWNERFDGTGKPAHLAGEDICRPIRIVRITLQYSKYISRKPFGYEMPKEEAVQRLREEAGHTFDPKLVEEFVDFIGEYSMKYDKNEE